MDVFSSGALPEEALRRPVRVVQALQIHVKRLRDAESTGNEDARHGARERDHLVERYVLRRARRRGN